MLPWFPGGDYRVARRTRRASLSKRAVAIVTVDYTVSPCHKGGPLEPARRVELLTC
jgi:hypothetical protein